MRETREIAGAISAMTVLVFLPRNGDLWKPSTARAT